MYYEIKWVVIGVHCKTMQVLYRLFMNVKKQGVSEARLRSNEKGVVKGGLIRLKLFGYFLIIFYWEGCNGGILDGNVINVKECCFNCWFWDVECVE